MNSRHLLYVLYTLSFLHEVRKKDPKSYEELEPIIKQQQEDIQQLQEQIQEERNRSSSSGDWLSSLAEGAVGAFAALI